MLTPLVQLCIFIPEGELKESAMERTYWFEEPSRYGKIIDRLGMTQDEYLSLVRLVIKAFPKDWVEKELARWRKTKGWVRHPLFADNIYPVPFYRLPYNPIPILFEVVSGGSWPVVDLIRLGRLLRTYEDVVGDQRIFKRLRTHDNYIGALFELEVLATFVEAGFSLKVPPEADGVDFTFEKESRTIFVEAGHCGISWILHLVNEIALRIPSINKSPHPKRSVRVLLDYRRVRGEDIAEEIAAKIAEAEMGLIDSGFEDPNKRYRIQVSTSKEGSLCIDWHEPTDYVYETKELLRRKLTQKRDQLSRHNGSFCAVDLRSLVPCITETDHDICATFLREAISVVLEFLEENPSVGGVLIWLRHVRRVRDPIVDRLNQNEIVLIASPDHLTEDEAGELFPFAKLPKDLDWYSG